MLSLYKSVEGGRLVIFVDLSTTVSTSLVSEQQLDMKFSEVEQAPVSSAAEVRVKHTLFVKVKFSTRLYLELL